MYDGFMQSMAGLRNVEESIGSAQRVDGMAGEKLLKRAAANIPI
jgi:hypothetical protein